MGTDQDGEGLSESEVVDTLFTLLFAGQSTVSMTVPHIIVNLMKRPDWYARIRAEATAKRWTEKSSIDDANSDTLNFIRETMRLWPAIDFVRRQRVDGGDISL